MEEESEVRYVPGSDHDDVEVGIVEGGRVYLGLSAKGSPGDGIFDLPNASIGYYLTVNEALSLSAVLAGAATEAAMDYTVHECAKYSLEQEAA